jgi:hypothetical protein
MPEVPDPAFVEQFIDDCRKLAVETPQIDFTLSYGGTLILIATCQLALRHPGFPPESARSMRIITERLIDCVARTATVRNGLEMGWYGEFDVPSPFSIGPGPLEGL